MKSGLRIMFQYCFTAAEWVEGEGLGEKHLDWGNTPMPLSALVAANGFDLNKQTNFS